MSGRKNTAWLSTMTAKLGSREAVTEFMKELASQGGKVYGLKKGFAGMPREKVRAAGHLGGSRSDRTGIKTGMGKTRRRRQEPLKKPSQSLYSRLHSFFGLIILWR